MPNVKAYPRKNKIVQSVIFDKDYYDVDEARKILNKLGYYDKGYDETVNFYRFRQYNPMSDKHYKLSKSKDFDGVSFVINF